MRKRVDFLKIVLIVAVGAIGCTQIPIPSQSQGPECLSQWQPMVVSWYGEPFHGRQAADGSIYDMYKFTAAHKQLPFGTRIIVQGLNGVLVEVEITDRGPYITGRDLDVSYATAYQLGMREKTVPGAVRLNTCFSYMPSF